MDVKGVLNKIEEQDNALLEDQLLMEEKGSKTLKNKELSGQKADLESLKAFVTYFSRMRNENQISEQEFSDLVKMISADFIEKEVERRAGEIFIGKINSINFFKWL